MTAVFDSIAHIPPKRRRVTVIVEEREFEAVDDYTDELESAIGQFIQESATAGIEAFRDGRLIYAN